MEPTFFVLLHPAQGRRVTDVRDISNKDGIGSESAGRLLAGTTAVGASVAYDPWAGQLLTLAVAKGAAAAAVSHTTP